ncbi:MAG: tRNA pseudouridine(54/55) synthase Pus10 [Thermoplasmata archaeon]
MFDISPYDSKLSAFDCLVKEFEIICDRCAGRLFYGFEHQGNRLTNRDDRKDSNDKSVRKVERSVREQPSAQPSNSLLQKMDYSALGHSIRTVWEKKTGTKVHDGECAICENIYSGISRFVKLAYDASKEYEFSTFLVGTRIDDELKNAEEKALSLLENSFGRKRQCREGVSLLKEDLNHEIASELRIMLNKSISFENPDIVFILDTRYDTVTCQVTPVYIEGRYRKLVRGIPQTKWPCRACRGKGCKRCNGSGRMYETSVEEIIAKEPVALLSAKGESFHGMGREDIDALMTGNGRPFVLEIEAPKYRAYDLKELLKRINESAEGKVEVTSLSYSSKERVRIIKEEEHSKTYLIHLLFENPQNREDIKKAVSRLSGKEIAQRTPERVSHRRADKVRNRRIYSAIVHLPPKRFGRWEYLKGPTAAGSAEKDEPAVPVGIMKPGVDEKVNHAIIEIHAQGGTYIKELMNGDEGRTQPNLSSLLGVPITCLALDVILIHDS